MLPRAPNGFAELYSLNFLPTNYSEEPNIIDWKALTDVCDDEAVMMEISTALCQDTPKCMEKILAAIREKDFANLELYAHRIKGATAIIGAKRISQSTAQLEQAGSREKLFAEIEKLGLLQTEAK